MRTFFLLAMVLPMACSHQRPSRQYDSSYKLGLSRSNDQAVLKKVLASHDHFFTNCFQDEIDQINLEHHKRDVAGKIELEMDISPNGKAEKVHVRSPNRNHSDEFKSCIRKVITEVVEFPPTTGKIQTVQASVQFDVGELPRLIWR